MEVFSTIKSSGDLAAAIDPKMREIELSALTRAPWGLSVAKSDAILRRLSAQFQTLETYLGRQPYFGIKTGLNKVFVINRETRDDLVARDASSAQIVKPVVGGRDVDRYRVAQTDSYLILARRGIELDKYPAVGEYLAKSRDVLTPKRDRSAKVGRKPGTYRWYELQDAVDYWEAFEQPKIIFPDISINPRFTIDTQGLYGLNTTYIIPSPDAALLGVLNSRAAFFLFRQICAGLEGGGTTYLRFFGDYLAGFPVPAMTDKSNLGRLVNSMLAFQNRLSREQLPERREQLQREIDATDRQIDQLVYQLYGLTEEEIGVVEAATA